MWTYCFDAEKMTMVGLLIRPLRTKLRSKFSTGKATISAFISIPVWAQFRNYITITDRLFKSFSITLGNKASNFRVPATGFKIREEVLEFF